MLEIADTITAGLGIYVLIGIVFAVYFVTVGIKGPGIVGRSLILRIMLFPGAVLIWPVLIFNRKSI